MGLTIGLDMSLRYQQLETAPPGRRRARAERQKHKGEEQGPQRVVPFNPPIDQPGRHQLRAE